MSNAINWNEWMMRLREEDGSAPTNGPPASQPGTAGDPMGGNPASPPPQGGPDPSVTAPPAAPQFDQDQDQDHPANDPLSPDMPDQDGVGHFEDWRNKYFKESIKGHSNLLIDMLNQVRDRDLHPPQRKFVEDNLQIQFLRQQSNVAQASKEMRKAINEQLDRNSPATTVIGHLDESLRKQRSLVDNLIKITGYYGMKIDLHRKYLAALLGAVQVGGGAVSEDIILNDHDYSVSLSTRIAKEFGKLDLGTWSLHANDPDRFLSDPEKKRLDHGSPDEREVLRHRIVVDSIVKRFDKRGFILTVVGDDGTVYNVGWDIATCLNSAYISGKLVVKTKQSETSEIMFSPEGGSVVILDLDIRYVKETGEVDGDGNRRKHEVPFLERRDGMLFLVAPLDLIREASHTLQGLAFKEIPYQGNPSDLKVLTRCVYSATEMIMRQC